MLKKLLSCMLTLMLIIGMIGGISSTTYAATVTGTDENGYKWSYNGTSVTITGYSGSGGNITIPSTENVNGVIEPVTNIGGYAFFNCNTIATVTIPSSLTSIGDDAFFYCSVTTVNIPSSITIIGSRAFYRCQGLKIVNIANGLKQISGDAFGYCTALATINLPNTLTSIGGAAFENCSSLKSIIIPSSVTGIGTEAFYCSGLTSVIIQNGITNTGDYTFYGCSKLNSVSLPTSLTRIGSYTFDGCSSLTSVVIPSNVGNVGGYAFYGCSNLTSVTDFNNATAFGSNVFGGHSSNLSLYGFSGSTENTYATSNSINFVPLAISSISMKSYPIKVQYTVGDKLDPTGAVITILYNSGSTQDMSVTSDMCNVTTYTSSGQQQVVVTLGGMSTYFNVTVTNPVTGITQLPGSIILDVGHSQQLTASVIPANADNSRITWSSSDNSIATVDNNGFVTGISAGAAAITATSVDGGYTTACNVTVQYISVAGIVLLPMDSTLDVGQTLNLATTIYPKNATDKTVTWMSSDTDVCTVDNNGVVTAKTTGSTAITVTSNDGSKIATCNIKVIIPVSNITISGTNTIIVGSSTPLSASIQPSNASNQQITWWSSNPSVVSVDQNGTIKGISAGSTTICAKAKDVNGVTATYNVTVTTPPIPILTPSPINMSGYTDPLAAALAAEQMAQASESNVQSQLLSLQTDLSMDQQIPANDETSIQSALAEVAVLQAEADALAEIIIATSAIPGSGDVTLEEAFEYSSIYAEIDNELFACRDIELRMPNEISTVATCEAEIEAEQLSLAQAQCDEIYAQTVAETIEEASTNLPGYLAKIEQKAQVVINKEVGTEFENYVKGGRLANVDYDEQQLYCIIDKETGSLVQVQPDFTIKSLATGEDVAIADAKTALSGKIPLDEQFKRLVWLTADEATTKTLIYYVPIEGEYVSQTMIDYAYSYGVKILEVVAK